MSYEPKESVKLSVLSVSNLPKHAQFDVANTNVDETILLNNNNYNNNNQNNNEPRDDEFQEIYPHLQLNEQEIMARVRKFSVFNKKEKVAEPLLKKIISFIDYWKPINKIISLYYDAEAGVYFKLNRWMTFHSIIITFFLICFIFIPGLIYGEYSREFFKKVIDVLVSENLESILNTPLFYGYYNYTGMKLKFTYYSMSTAYFWTNALTRLCYTLFLLRKVILNVSNLYADFEDKSWSVRPSQLLGKWNYKIGAQSSKLYPNKSLITMQLKKIISVKKSITKMEIFFNVLINVLCYATIGIVANTFIGLLSVNEEMLASTNAKDIGIIPLFRMPILAAASLIIITWIFDICQHLEHYRSKWIKLSISIMRIAILNFTTLIIFIQHYTTMVTCARNYHHGNGSLICNLKNKEILLQKDSLIVTCWESWLGLRIITTILIYVAVCLAFYFLLDLFKTILTYLQSNILKPIFFQRTIVGHLIFIDGLFWLGYYYCPALTILWLLMLILTYFYHVGFVMISTSLRSSTVWDSSLQKASFLMLMTFSSLTGMGALIYHSFALRPSKLCGPFQHLNHNFDSENFYKVENLNIMQMLLKLLDITTGHNGIWYFAILIFLAFFIRFLFRASGLNKIKQDYNREKNDVARSFNIANQELVDVKQKIKRRKLFYKPVSVECNEVEQLFDTFYNLK